MSDIKTKGITIINDYVKEWTKKYFFQTTYQEEITLGHVFMTEFSLPVKSKPIPKATVKVYFYLKEDEQGEVKMEFRFENDSLIHRPDRTLRITQMERLLEKFLEKKSMTSKILFLGTEFESSRIKDIRLDKIFDEMNYKEEKKEEIYLSDNLLQNKEELTIADKFVDETKQIETMKNSLFSVFRAVDQQDMGVVSFKECVEVFERMGLDLTEDQWTELMQIADKDRNGVIQYAEFVFLGATVIHVIFMKNQAEKQLKLREEAMLILNVDGIHDVRKAILEKCTKLDEDEEYIIKIADLKNILEEVSKGVEGEYPADVINEQEIEDIMKIVLKKAPTGVFPYHQIYELILEYKIENLKNGLMEGSLNKLEKYIRELCVAYDSNNTGLININDLMKSLSDSKQIILSKIQTYIIQSFIERDENQMVNYIINSRILAAIIKKFFTLDLLRKKSILVKEGLVKPDQYMKGWAHKEIEQELGYLFNLFDVDKDQLLSLEEMKQGFESIQYSITEDEISTIIQEKGKVEENFLTLDEFKNNFYPLLKVLRCKEAIQNLVEI